VPMVAFLRWWVTNRPIVVVRPARPSG